MSKLKALNCPNCSSPDIKRKPGGMATCGHCGSNFILYSKDQIEFQAPNTKRNFLAVMLILSVLGILSVFWIFSQNSTKNSPTRPKPYLTQEVTFKKIPNSQPSISKEVDLEILNVTQGQTIVGGLFWIFEVKNTGESDSGKIKAVVSLFDKQGQRLKEQNGWSHSSKTKANEVTEILVLINKPPESYDKAEFNTFAKLPTRYEGQQVKFNVSDYKIEPLRNGFEIVGDVTNPYGFTLDFVKLIAVGYDKNNIPIGLANQYASNKTLKSGGSSGFKISAGTFFKQRPDSWKVYAIAQVLAPKN